MPAYSEHLVAFYDILGFSQYVRANPGAVAVEALFSHITRVAGGEQSMRISKLPNYKAAAIRSETPPPRKSPKLLGIRPGNRGGGGVDVVWEVTGNGAEIAFDCFADPRLEALQLGPGPPRFKQ